MAEEAKEEKMEKTNKPKENKSNEVKETITKDMTFAEVLEKYPQTAEPMFKNGLHCIGCHGAAFETIEQGCKMHGLDDETITKMVKEMNEIIKKK